MAIEPGIGRAFISMYGGQTQKKSQKLIGGALSGYKATHTMCEKEGTDRTYCT